MQLVVGRIGKPHGIRGDVTVDVRTDDVDARFAPGATLVTDPVSAGPLTVATARWHSGRLVVRFAGVADRDRAEELRGTYLVIDSAEILTSSDPDDFHDQQLIGLKVVTTSGEEIGTVSEILHHAQVLVVVDTPAGDRYVPFVAALVPEVDLEGGRLVVDPPGGLFD
ncbi:ribosome maturation factor RimM [Actinocorallia sp. A-T 12471]|uniref:ribosome maturation factor RimM n=1 Tax=Actinocorallia sp. A-T 12471 TaxID=3089813 RepID=UPI0029CD59F9|nr:ribosome maturation factor RimM [Actinocorallia sp. A-T 12471]MDX6739121.1 ribosome maturation factor RimM [Actinocorallia sp. A-T 12471]